MKCQMPDCQRQIPEFRLKLNRITCCKKCGNAWSHVPTILREKIRGKKYKKVKKK